MSMRGLGTALVVAGMLGVVPADGRGEEDSKKKMLTYAPVVKGASVEYDRPADQKAVDACQFEYNKQPSAFILRDAQGKLLRRFSCSKPTTKKIDQWSYYQDGFEVYREVDLDGDGFVDEARWLNGGGTRVATVKYLNSTYLITGWKRISAEEASKVLVQGLVTPDVDLIESVMATPEELEALGVPASEQERARAGQKGRAAELGKLRKGLIGWTTSTVWLRLDAAMPHLIPADAAAGLKDDLTLYENAVIFAGPPGGGPTDRTAFLQASEIVRVGEVWKLVDLPRAINPSGKDPVIASAGGIREAIYRQDAAPGVNPALAAAIGALGQFDNANADKFAAADKRVAAAAYSKRLPLLREVEKVSPTPEDKLTATKQIIDTLGKAYETGHFAEGLKVLNAYEADGGKAASYAAYRRLNAEYALENDIPGNNGVAAQKKWMADMKDFLGKYQSADEVPEILFQLASNNEFNGEEKDARDYYKQLVTAYPDTLPGRKAAGAVRRLDLIGQPIALKGKGLDGETVDAAQYRGKTVLVMFWATWAQPVRRDMPEIAKLYEKYKPKGFEIVGVNLDNDPAEFKAFLQQVPQPWPNISEPGSLDGRLAVDYGVVLVPTMILVDDAGKVVDRFVRSAADLDVKLEKVFNGKSPVALGNK